MTQTEQACVEAMEIISQSQRTPSSSRVLCQKNLQRSIKKKTQDTISLGQREND
jgi:hypothetical protein